MFLRTIGVLAALFLSTSFAHAAIDPHALAQEYIDQGYAQIEVKVGTSIVKVEAVKDGTKFEFTYNVETGEIVKSESEPVGFGSDTMSSEDDDDHGSIRSSEDDDDENDDSSDDDDDDHDESEDDSGDDDSGEDDSGDDD